MWSKADFGDHHDHGFLFLFFPESSSVNLELLYLCWRETTSLSNSKSLGETLAKRRFSPNSWKILFYAHISSSFLGLEYFSRSQNIISCNISCMYKTTWGRPRISLYYGVTALSRISHPSYTEVSICKDTLYLYTTNTITHYTPFYDFIKNGAKTHSQVIFKSFFFRYKFLQHSESWLKFPLCWISHSLPLTFLPILNRDRDSGVWGLW